MRRIANYQEFLAKAGPDDGPLTEEHLRFRIQLLGDPWWLDELKISERDAALLLAKYRSMLNKLTEVPEQRRGK